MSSADDWDNDIDESVAATGDAKTSEEHPNKAEPKDIGGDNSQTASIECKMSPLQVLENTFISVIRVLTTESNEANNSSAGNSLKHLAAEIDLGDYAHELAFLPDLTETSATELDFSAINVQKPELTTDQQERLVGVLVHADKVCCCPRKLGNRRSSARSASVSQDQERNAVLPWGTELLQQIHPELCSLRCRPLPAQR
ncbi:unnamed protein product [Phytophthora lilii]|uniref:Unnamed protein product n=1 Tax=Phytophthora lilii TaxID=2077276 RepID=A0A9W7DDK6_9STRA|nr:unnamed protein product [Phytophthora lilii]